MGEQAIQRAAAARCVVWVSRSNQQQLQRAVLQRLREAFWLGRVDDMREVVGELWQREGALSAQVARPRGPNRTTCNNSPAACMQSLRAKQEAALVQHAARLVFALRLVCTHARWLQTL